MKKKREIWEKKLSYICWENDVHVEGKGRALKIFIVKKKQKPRHLLDRFLLFDFGIFM